jgi:hypothetical protein
LARASASVSFRTSPGAVPVAAQDSTEVHPRIEGRQLAIRPADRVFLRASTRHLQMPAAGRATPGMNRWRAATAAALVLARADAGVLTSTKVAPVRAEVSRVLGAADLAKAAAPAAQGPDARRRRPTRAVPDRPPVGAGVGR